jgi:hypothetical protein
MLNLADAEIMRQIALSTALKRSRPMVFRYISRLLISRLGNQSRYEE